MRCSFALIWDKKFNDKLGNNYHRIALELPVERFSDLVVETVNKKLPTVSNLTRWEMVKQLFSSVKPRLNQKDILKDIVLAIVQDFKDESNWVNSDHGEVE
jgi:hypothetical protein